INGMIKNINLRELINKTEHLNQMVLDYKLGSLYGYQDALSFEGLRYLILPSKESHPGLDQYDYTVLNKNIISTLEIYLYNHSFQYNKLIRQFIDIFNRKNNNLETENKYFLNITPFFMTLYLDHLLKFNQLEGVHIMEKRNLIAALQDEKITAYFNTHSQIYENNFYAQGLFILGMYIAAIESEQRKKNIKSTLINRLNLRGIPVQKVKSLMAMVDEMGKVWDIFYDSVTENYYRECMQGIEKSSLSPEEIIFHILCGRAYSNYLGAIYKQEHPDKTEKNQEEQND
nr:TM1802 family CRISPR-associated protein [Candidatus Cloacimonas acidaminovorans]